MKGVFKMSKTCMKCHGEIAEDATVCPNCGAEQTKQPPVEATASPYVQNADKLSSKYDIPSLIGIIAGGFCSITGLFILAMFSTYELNAITFGADFYTYIYDGLIALIGIVNNAQNILALGFGFSLLFFGIFMICFFSRTVSKDQNK